MVKRRIKSDLEYDPVSDPMNASYKGTVPDWPACLQTFGKRTFTFTPPKVDNPYVNFIRGSNLDLHPSHPNYNPGKLAEVATYAKSRQTGVLARNANDEEHSSFFSTLLEKGVTLPLVQGVPVSELKVIARDFFRHLDDVLERAGKQPF